MKTQHFAVSAVRLCGRALAAAALVAGWAHAQTSTIRTPNSPPARTEYMQEALASGKVLYAGGQDSTGNSSASAWEFDPDTYRWVATGSMLSRRQAALSVRLTDGNVLVTGGWNRIEQSGWQSGETLYSSEVYDTSARSWRSAGWEPWDKASAGTYAVAALPGAKAFLLGTTKSFTYSSTGWETAAQPAIPDRWAATLTALKDGRVLLVGGVSKMGRTQRVELYDPKTNTWSRGADLDVGRASHSATLLADGRVLVAGGTAGALQETVASAVIYDPALDKWNRAASMAKPRTAHGATALTSGRVLVVGGSTDGVTTLELYYPDADRWVPAGSASYGGSRVAAMTSERAVSTPDAQQGSSSFVVEFQRGDECLFNWAEVVYGSYLAPALAATAQDTGWKYRTYASTNSALGIRDSRVYYLGPASGRKVLDMGSLSSWMAKSGCG